MEELRRKLQAKEQQLHKHEEQKQARQAAKQQQHQQQEKLQQRKAQLSKGFAAFASAAGAPSGSAGLPEASEGSTQAASSSSNVADAAEVARVLSSRNDHACLKLHVGATLSQVRKSYRQLAMGLHPDKCKLEGANEAFQRLNLAYKNLSKQMGG